MSVEPGGYVFTHGDTSVGGSAAIVTFSLKEFLIGRATHRPEGCWMDYRLNEILTRSPVAAAL